MTGSGYFYVITTLFHIDPLDLVHARDGGDAVHCGLEFAHRMDGEVYGADTDIVCRLCPEASHREMEFLSYALNQIAQKMVSVYSSDTYADRIKTVASLLEVDCNDRISLLGSDSDRRMAVTLMNLYRSVAVVESDDLVPRKSEACAKDMNL